MNKTFYKCGRRTIGEKCNNNDLKPRKERSILKERE